MLPYGIHHTGYTVSDLDRSLDFYHGLLGLEIVGQQVKQGGYLGAIVGYPDAHVKQAHLRVPGSDHVVVTMTLSKSLASQGGVVLGPALLREHLINRARPFIFDTGLTPASCAAALAALRRRQCRDILAIE